MIKSEKKHAEFSGLLNKEDPILVSQAIDLLRDEEPFEGAIGLLASLYDRSNDASIRKKVELFLNDLKDPSLRTEMVSEIKKPWKGSTASMLVSSCWQSGLDYSEYSDDFTEIFIAGDYATAIECYTVISEAADSISREKKDLLVSKLEKSSSPSDEKSALTSVMISELEN